MEHEELAVNDEGKAFVLLPLQSFDNVTDAGDLDHVETLAVSNLYGYIFVASTYGRAEACPEGEKLQSTSPV